ncbi:MAG: zinc ribbon domain-containing protein [Desulfovibrio sp.]|nr:zinc ribbon domain-containing protein [Desulfovibrio sp.]
MPIYEYQCPECGRIFEEWTKITEAHGQEPCPDCGTSSPRLISHTSFVLKGGGWYVTDYGYRKNVSEDGQAKPSAEPKGQSQKSESQSQEKATKPTEQATPQAKKSTPKTPKPKPMQAAS